jgi:hypothetical protein
LIAAPGTPKAQVTPSRARPEPPRPLPASVPFRRSSTLCGGAMPDAQLYFNFSESFFRNAG